MTLSRRRGAIAKRVLPRVGFYAPQTQTDWNNFVKSGASGGIGLTPTRLITYIDKTIPWSSANTYSSFECNTNLKAAWLPTVAQGCVPLCDMYTVMTASGTASQNWTSVAAGTFDSNITAYLNGFVTGGFSKIYLRIDSEMNLSTYPWFVNNSTDMAAELAAWKHIADLAHNISGLNVRTIWNPQAGSIFNLTGMYPSGSGTHGRYVDLIGLDSYATWNQPNSVGTNTSSQIDNMCALARSNNLPFCLPETGVDLGSPNAPTQGAAWIASLATELQTMRGLGTNIEFAAFYCSGGNYIVLDGTHAGIVTAIRNLWITMGYNPA